MIISNPLKDGYSMPAEFEEHQGCIMIWPSRPGSWPFGAAAAQKAFAQIAVAIAKSETVYMLSDARNIQSAREKLPEHINIIEIESNDAWARDIGPTFVTDKKGGVRGVNWEFNAWGGEYDGLYMDWEKDNAVAGAFCDYLEIDCYDASPFVLEGGAIHSDGEGTILVTEACLLSKGRNPQLTKEQIEQKLRDFLGVEKVLWLPRGIYGDETNEHVDNICAFVKPAEVVLAWTDNRSDPQYKCSLACFETLSEMTDAKGRKIKIHKLPIPNENICINEEDLKGFVFEDGEDKREAGERLAASYVNFYIANDSVILPQFGDKNDIIAIDILSKLFTTRKIVPIAARDILLGGGNIHCITQQIPKGGRDA